MARPLLVSSPHHPPLSPPADIDRYSQGVQFNFQPSGLVYKFNYNYLITTLAVAFVLLGVAGTITDVVAFFCLPDAHSKVLSSYRFQTVTKRQGFAELGMKTALASIDFTAFDPDNNKSIEAEDIVRVLAAVSLDDSDDPEVRTLYTPARTRQARAVCVELFMALLYLSRECGAHGR
jgi:hypothetical protein